MLRSYEDIKQKKPEYISASGLYKSQFEKFMLPEPSLLLTPGQQEYDRNIHKQ